MNKDLAINNILSLHQELQNATEMHDMYLVQRDFKMTELWSNQMDLIVQEMIDMGGDR